MLALTEREKTIYAAYRPAARCRWNEHRPVAGFGRRDIDPIASQTARENLARARPRAAGARRRPSGRRAWHPHTAATGGAASPRWRGRCNAESFRTRGESRGPASGRAASSPSAPESAWSASRPPRARLRWPPSGAPTIRRAPAHNVRGRRSDPQSARRWAPPAAASWRPAEATRREGWPPVRGCPREWLEGWETEWAWFDGDLRRTERRRRRVAKRVAEPASRCWRTWHRESPGQSPARCR